MKDTIKHKSNDEKDLVNLKMQFILKEYQSYFDMNPINLSRISSLHSWEIALLSGLLLSLISGKINAPVFISILH